MDEVFALIGVVVVALVVAAIIAMKLGHGSITITNKETGKETTFGNLKE